MGLDDVRFGGICSTLTNMEPLLKLSQVYQRVVRDERQQSITRNKEERSDVVVLHFKLQTGASRGHFNIEKRTPHVRIVVNMGMSFLIASRSRVTRIGGVNVEEISEIIEELEISEEAALVLVEVEEPLVVLEGGEVRILLVLTLPRPNPRITDLCTWRLLNLQRL